MFNYAIFSNLRKDLKLKTLFSSFNVQIPAEHSIALTNFAPNDGNDMDEIGHSTIEFCIVNDDSSEDRTKSYQYSIPWDGNAHKVEINILSAPGGSVISNSSDLV